MTKQNISDKSDLQNILSLLGDLQIRCGVTANSLKNKRALYYFQYGINRRLSIISKNLDFFYSVTPPDRQKPLDENETSLATMHINSLYVNLYGAIDNIAWTLTYECNLYPNNLNIENSPQKNEINLFHKKFLRKLEDISHSFANYKKYLDTKSKWFDNLLQFRHPSTHRIPLYVIPAIINKSETEKYIHHQSQHLIKAHYLNFKKADEHFNYLNSLGIFIPLFTHDPEIEPSPIYPSIITDCENLSEITNQFLDSLVAVNTL